MIGPVANAAALPDPARGQIDRPRDVSSAQSRGEEAERAEAANEQAATDRSAIVGALDAALTELGVPLKGNQPYLRIEQDQESGRFIYKSVDQETGEVVREWPEEEVRRALKALGSLRGALVDKAV